MKALLLAAGLGSRLRPLTDQMPKCLVPIRGKPLLYYWLALLTQQGIDDIYINTHYLPHLVEDFIIDSPFREKVTLLHEPTLLGTAGTILKFKKFFGKEAFFVAHADNLTRFDLSAFQEVHRRRRSHIEITMMTFITDRPENAGIVKLDEYNAVIGFYEKSNLAQGSLANAAVYIIEASVVDFLVSLKREIIDMSTEVLPHYVGRMQAFHNADYHRDIGTPHSLQLAEMEF